TKYGNIEDLLLGLEVVLPSGDTLRLAPVPRASTGPSLREIFLGSEGTLGIVTEVTMRLFPLRERRRLESFVLRGVAAGPDLFRRVVRAGGRPAVLRLYDAIETARPFSQWAPPDACLLLVVCEGPAALADAELTAVTAAAGGAQALGAAPVEHWL